MPVNNIEYPFLITPLSESDGGGFMIEFPDLAGCISDGETPDEAIANGVDALKCWLATAKKNGDYIPAPNSVYNASGKWLQRAPKSLHSRLAAKAQMEGVSLNTLVISLISEGLVRRAENL